MFFQEKPEKFQENWCFSKKKECFDEVKNMEKTKNWFVANNDGKVVGHDLRKTTAKLLAEMMQEKEPTEGWEALDGAQNE